MALFRARQPRPRSRAQTVADEQVGVLDPLADEGGRSASGDDLDGCDDQGAYGQRGQDHPHLQPLQIGLGGNVLELLVNTGAPGNPVPDSFPGGCLRQRSRAFLPASCQGCPVSYHGSAVAGALATASMPFRLPSERVRPGARGPRGIMDESALLPPTPRGPRGVTREANSVVPGSRGRGPKPRETRMLRVSTGPVKTPLERRAWHLFC